MRSQRAKVSLAACLVMAYRCDCRIAPFLVQLSTADLAADLGVSKRRAVQVLDALIDSGIVYLETAATGRSAAIYRLIF